MRVPRHVAIVMDGNGRWARERGLPRVWGHYAGVEAVRDAIATARDVGVEWLTLYTFSSENWARPKEEIEALMALLTFLLVRELPELRRQGVRLWAMGRLSMLPERVQDSLRRAQELTQRGRSLNVVLAISYGSRWEIADAARALAQEAARGRLDPGSIDPELLSRHLYLPEAPDPDLLIRTSGEQRISNFLLWQLAYTELYFTPVLWPDFRREHFLSALEDYSRRERRFGAV